MLRLRLSTLISGLLLLITCSSIYAHVSVIVSVPPPMPERVVVTPPPGYMTCYRTPAGFYQGVWVNSHQVCEYNSRPGGAVWVAGHWQCLHYREMDGQCLRWGWIKSHWASREVEEYGVVWHEPAYYQPRPHYSYGYGPGPRPYWHR